MISSIVSRLVILVFGTLYPAYASYKAVRSRDVREYVKWMMYWIVFALFTCGETITDVFLSFWFPFYYEIKIGFVLWLLSPATKGSSILYRKFVHPMLTNREQEIDEYIARAKEQGYHTVLHLGSKGVNYATNVIMQTAIKGGGGLVNQLRKSYSLSDLTEGESEPVGDVNRNNKDADGLEFRGNRRADRVDGSRPSNRARGYSPRRSASGSARMEMYFPEVDLEVRQRRGSSRSREPSVPLSHIRSSEDVSYMSNNHFYEDASEMDPDQAIEEVSALPAAEGPLIRTASVGSTRSTRTKGAATTRTSSTSSTSTAAKKATQGEEMEGSGSEEEDFWSDPMDDISPTLDRTIFVDDRNTFPTHPHQVAVESVHSSMEVVHGLDVELDADECYRDSAVTLEKPEVETVESVKSDTVDTTTTSGVVSCTEPTKVSDKSGMNASLAPETVDLHVEEKSSDVPESCDSPSLLPSAADENTVDPLKESSINPVSDELNTGISQAQNTGVVAEEFSSFDGLKDVESSVASPVTSPLTSPADVNSEEKNVKPLSNKSSDPVAKSSSASTVEVTTSLEETKAVPSEPTLNVDTGTGTKESESLVKEKECEDPEKVSEISTADSKEEQSVDARGGKYHKPPAPRPPQQDDFMRGGSLEPDDECGKTVRARLVLKPGIVRSLPDVTMALSDNMPPKSEVFMAMNASQLIRRRSTSRSPAPSPKPGHKRKFLLGVATKSKSSKGTENTGFPRFFNMPGRPHLGSLTSIFPFWGGGASSSGGGDSVGKGGKKSTNHAEECDKKANGADGEQGQSGGSGVSGKASEKQFPVGKMSHSPTRYRASQRL